MPNAKPAFLASVRDPRKIITAIDGGLRFPEILPVMREKYSDAIQHFRQLILNASDSADLLDQIRRPEIDGKRRMALLKLFRRCVSGVCDTEATKKVERIKTAIIVKHYGVTFKPIEKLKEQFANPDAVFITALAVSIGEYDNRGQQGYMLASQFIDWFEQKFENRFTIRGPRGAGRDIELATIWKDFHEACPCDIVVLDSRTKNLVAIGFVRYDSTRGGAQSDDRTSGNANKVSILMNYCHSLEKSLRMIFVTDGPGLAHGDTWREAVALDDTWNGNVRVTTLKLANKRITLEWLLGNARPTSK